MIKSMTGFGRSQVNSGGYQVTCEIRGVNHRYFDTYIRIPRRYNILEEQIKEELKKYVSRGRLEININIEKTEESARNIKLDKDLAMAYYNYLKDLAKYLEIPPEIKIIDVFRLPDVFTLEDREDDIQVIWQLLQTALADAMYSLVEMRSKEGQLLAVDLKNRIDKLIQMVEMIAQRSPEVSQEYARRLHSRIDELIGQQAADEQRILQEVAIFADKSSITEEIVRLRSHFSHFYDLLDAGETVGRKCDFLVQEMFREINTVASKANDLEISHVVVEVKAELEKIREQLQNIE